jgi:hypothetical protein
MKTNKVKEKKYLPGDRLYKAYMAMGDARTIGKMMRWCITNQIVNPATLSLPTRMGIWKAIWRWAAENYQEAYDIAREVYPTMDKQEWDVFLYSKSKTAFQNRREAKNHHYATR